MSLRTFRSAPPIHLLWRIISASSYLPASAFTALIFPKGYQQSHTQLAVLIMMEILPNSQEILAALKSIVSERDALRHELSVAKQTITELELQNTEFDRLLTIAHKQFYTLDPPRGPVSPLRKSWIGTWLTSPLDHPSLSPVEEAWRSGRLQQALTMMPALLAREDLGEYHHVNCRLLYSALIQSSGSDFSIALQYAEEALQIATHQKLHQLVGKAHFHRGLCYLYIGEPAKAKWCFILSSHLDYHEDIIEECRLSAEKEVDALPAEDPKRSTNFRLHR